MIEDAKVQCILCNRFVDASKSLPTCCDGRVCGECESKIERQSRRGKEIPMLFEAVMNGTAALAEAYEIIERREARRVARRRKKA